MKKNIILISLSFFASAMILAQSFDVQLFPEKRNIDPSIVRFSNSYYFYELDMEGLSGFSANLKRFMQNIKLKKYNGRLEEVKQIIVPGPEKSFGPLYPFLKVIQNKLCLMYFKPAEKDNIDLWATTIDTNTLNVSGDKKILTLNEDDRIIQYHLRSVDRRHPNRTISKGRFTTGAIPEYRSFFLETSADKSKTLVVWTSGWSKTLYYSVLDKDLNTIRTKKEEVPQTELIVLSNAAVANDGTAYISWYFSKKNKINGEILVSTGNSSKINPIDITSGEVAGVTIQIDEFKNKLLAAGPYKENTDYLAGVFIQSFDLNGMKAGEINKTPFTKDLITVLDKEGLANSKEKKYGVNSEIIFEALLLADGTLNLTGEFTKIAEGVRANFKLSGSIINARFDKTGKAVFTRIPKRRVSAGSTVGDSYRAYTYKDKVLIFYDDYLSNLKRDLNDEPIRSDVYINSVLVAGIIDANGILKREVVKDLSAEDYLAITDNMQEIRPGTYFIPFLRFKNLGGSTGDIKLALIEAK